MKETIQRLTGLQVQERENPQPGLAVGVGKVRIVIPWQLASLVVGLLTVAILAWAYVSKVTGRIVPIKGIIDVQTSTNDWRRVAEERHMDLTNRLQRIEDKCKKR